MRHSGCKQRWRSKATSTVRVVLAAEKANTISSMPLSNNSIRPRIATKVVEMIELVKEEISAVEAVLEIRTEEDQRRKEHQNRTSISQRAEVAAVPHLRSQSLQPKKYLITTWKRSLERISRHLANLKRKPLRSRLDPNSSMFTNSFRKRTVAWVVISSITS